MKVFLDLVDFAHTVNFLIWSGPGSDIMPGDRRLIAKPVKLEFIPWEPGTHVEPTFRIDGGREFLQSLRDALDNLGVPGNRHAKVEGLLEAQKAHLEDMRKIALKIK